MKFRESRTAKNLYLSFEEETQARTRYNFFAENIATNRVFEKEEEKLWRCLCCGYIHKGKAAPEKCPACVKPSGYFELLYKNW